MLAIVGNHTNISAIAGESNAFYRSRAWRAKAFAAWDAALSGMGKQRWAEKSPKHVKRIAAILEWFPESQIVLMLRDGRDVACSIRERCGDLRVGIDRWIQDNLAARQFWRHPQVSIVRYEDLVRKTETTLATLLEFLAEPYEPGLVELGGKNRRWYSDNITRPASPFGAALKQYRNWQINQPLFDGTKRWCREMSKYDKVEFKRLAGDLLFTLGYSTTTNW